MYKKNIYLGTLLLIFFLLPASIKPAIADSPNSFQVLVDTNLLFPDEAVQGSRFAADGVWSVPTNSNRYGRGAIDWPATLKALNAQKWNVSEDLPPDTREVDFVSSSSGHMVTGAMIYDERNSSNTIATDDQIQQYSSHVVPGFGKVGKRIIILGRTFRLPETYGSVAAFKLAVQNPLVSGGAFEFAPSWVNNGGRYDVGCQFVLSLGKKCYFLLPPGTHSDYLSEIQNLVGYLKNNNSGLLNSHNFYIVLAAYNRDINGHNPIHYVSTGPNDRHSIEAAVKWLNTYRGIKNPTPTPTPSTGLIPGDLTSQGDTPNNHVNIYDYNILIGNFGKTGSNIVGDIDHNNKVDIFDYNILVGNFGK